MTLVLTFWLIRPFQYQEINHFIVEIIISILGKGRFSIFVKNDYLILNYSNVSDSWLLILK